MKVILNGCSVDFDACVNLMDDELRELIHNSDLETFDDQSFLDWYCIVHEIKYGETFQI